MGAERVQIDVDELMQQISYDVANRPRVPLPRSSTSDAPVTPQIEAPVQAYSRPSLSKRIKGKSKRYWFAIAGRLKQFRSRVRQALLVRKNRLKARFLPARIEPVPPQPDADSSQANPLIQYSDSAIRVAILTPCLVDGDAVGNDVIGMYRVLTQHGYYCEIFAEAWSVTEVNVNHINQVERFLVKPADILIYHYSIGWDSGLAALQTIDCKKIVKYHNVTPPEFYEEFSEEYANVCRAGQAQIKLVTQIPNALYLADSAFSEGELHELGITPENSGVLPPFHLIDQLQYTEPDFSVLDAYRDDKINILMVGRLAPNKGHAALIDAFNIYHHFYNRNSRLLIVGKADPRLNQYNDFLHKKVKDLGLANAIVFTGSVSPEALKSYYLVSHVFMITSEHEGFCVPLVEAMSVKLPIVAYASTAIPMTVSKAGLVWPQRDPERLAGSLHCIATNEEVRYQLGEFGWRRYQETFTNRRIEAALLQFIERLSMEQTV